MNKKEKIWTPANIVTVIRICGVPVFIIAILAPWPEVFGEPPFYEAIKPWIAAAIFAILAATDGVDGYLARSRNEVTTFGKFIDPIADKILTASALIALVELLVIPSWIVIVILSREFIVSGLRMIAASQGTVIAASWYGKAKTVTQIIAIILFIIKDSLIANLPQDIHSVIVFVSWAVMIVALVLTIISMCDYLAKARPLLGFGDDNTAESDEASESFEDKINPEVLSTLASEVIVDAKNRGALLVCAESLTGGLISAYLTSIPGSSEVLAGSYVTYSNELKHSALLVENETIIEFGAVSEQTALQMAKGAMQASGAFCAVSVTGIAGPSGAVPGKPVGTVWIGVSTEEATSAQLFTFSGSREEVRLQTVYEALCAFKKALI